MKYLHKGHNAKVTRGTQRPTPILIQRRAQNHPEWAAISKENNIIAFEKVVCIEW